MNRETIKSVINNVQYQDEVELIDVLQLNDMFQIRFFAVTKEDEDKVLDAMDDMQLYLKSIKHDKDGYVIAQFTVSNPSVKSEPVSQPKEIKMNQINFVATPDAKIIVIDSTPTKRTANVQIKALLPAVSLSTMRDRKIEREAKAMLGFKPMPKNSEESKMSQVPQTKTTPSIQAEIDALRGIIAHLSPEAHAEAVKQGLIRGAQAQFNREMHSIKHVGIDRQTTKGEVKSTTRANAIGKRQRAEIIKRECACGCGGLTGGAFCMGHDARAKGQWLRQLRGTYLPNEIGWQPTPELIAYATNNPQWSSEIYASLDL